MPRLCWSRARRVRRRLPPLPLGYSTFGAFLTGFADAVGPDVAAIADDLYDPELLPHTGALWHYDSFSDAFLLAPVTRAGRKLIDACRAVGYNLQRPRRRGRWAGLATAGEATRTQARSPGEA